MARAGDGGLRFGLAAVTLALVVARLVVPQRAHSAEELREVRYGYPVPFLALEFTVPPATYPVTLALDPWEDLTRLELHRFAASFALVYAPLFAAAALVSRRRRPGA